MFEAWGRALYTRRRLTLGIALVLVAFAAVWGTGVFGKLSAGNSFTPPDSQSQREADQASQVFGRNDADVVVLYRSATRTVGDPAYRQAVTAALSGLPRAEVTRVSTYWSTGSPRLLSADRHATYALLQLTGVQLGFGRGHAALLRVFDLSVLVSASRHSGQPSSRRSAERPASCSWRTASWAYAQNGPRQ